MVVRIPAGLLGSLKCDPPKGNGHRPQKKDGKKHWNEIRDLMSLQKSMQLGGPEVRKRGYHLLAGETTLPFGRTERRVGGERTP